MHVTANDTEGRHQLARYVIRNPFSFKKMAYKAKQGLVVDSSKLQATLKCSFQIIPSVASASTRANIRGCTTDSGLMNACYRRPLVN